MASPVIIRVRRASAEEKKNRGACAGVIAIFPDRPGKAGDPNTMLYYGKIDDSPTANFGGGVTYGSCRGVIGREPSEKQVAAMLAQLEWSGHTDLIVVKPSAAAAYATIRAKAATR